MLLYYNDFYPTIYIYRCFRMDIKKTSLLYIFLVIIVMAFPVSVFAAGFKANIILPESGSFIISFDAVRDHLNGSDIYTIGTDRPDSLYLLKDMSKAFKRYSTDIKLDLSKSEGNDLIYYIDTGDDYTTDIYIDLPVSGFVYELDIYCETTPDTYALYKSNISIYNFDNGDRSLNIGLQNEKGKKYKIIFKDAALKMDPAAALNVTLFKQDDFSMPEVILDPLEVYEKQLDDGTYEYMYDFYKMVFIDTAGMDKDPLKVYSSSDAQHFNIASAADLDNGLYTRFLKLITEEPFGNKPAFTSYRRYIILEGEKGSALELMINSEGSMYPPDIKQADGKTSDFKTLSLPEFAVMVESKEQDGSGDINILIIFAVMLFLIYPGYLLYRSVRLKLIK
jgi:hypothetical protein